MSKLFYQNANVVLHIPKIPMYVAYGKYLSSTEFKSK